MRILLLGEYSGLYTNLRDGLRKLGHEAVIAAGGDGWKKITSDIRFDTDAAPIINKMAKNILPFFKLRQLSGFDVVQIINPLVLYRNFGINRTFLKFILSSNNKIFLSAAGDDSFYAAAVDSQKFRYSPLPDYLKFDLRGRSFPYGESAVIEWNKELASQVHGIIPIAYEYAEAYRNHENVKVTIPMPINVEKIKYSENELTERMVFYHGINRPGFKGTRHIMKAFEALRDLHAKSAEFITGDSIPYMKYLEVIKKTNVIIDQANSYSCAMNALISMAMGKVVMSGNEPESIRELGQEHSPVINILPDEKYIISEIEYLLDQRSLIPELGYKSRVFVEKNHDYIDVAQKYLNVWNA